MCNIQRENIMKRPIASKQLMVYAAYSDHWKLSDSYNVTAKGTQGS